jgi:hypothetical protein
MVGDEGLVYAVDLWEEGLQLLQQEIDSKRIIQI